MRKQTYKPVSDQPAFGKLVWGFTLIELLVVMTIIALLVAIAIPAINAMQKSFDSTGAESMISTALATARTLAISHKPSAAYAGVRFQKVYDPTDALKADQYMIFIIEGGTAAGWTCGFSAIEGYRPIKLPENIGVVDNLIWPVRHIITPPSCTALPVQTPPAPTQLDDVPANLDPDNNNRNITDISTFSIVFSPAGKLVSKQMRCGAKGAGDDVFNTIPIITGGTPPAGMFAMDDEETYGTGVEMSRREFILYDRTKFKALKTGLQRYNYLNDPAKVRRINAYTGEIIK